MRRHGWRKCLIIASKMKIRSRTIRPPLPKPHRWRNPAPAAAAACLCIFSSRQALSCSVDSATHSTPSCLVRLPLLRCRSAFAESNRSWTVWSALPAGSRIEKTEPWLKLHVAAAPGGNASIAALVSALSCSPDSSHDSRAAVCASVSLPLPLPPRTPYFVEPDLFSIVSSTFESSLAHDEAEGRRLLAGRLSRAAWPRGPLERPALWLVGQATWRQPEIFHCVARLAGELDRLQRIVLQAVQLLFIEADGPTLLLELFFDGAQRVERAVAIAVLDHAAAVEDIGVHVEAAPTERRDDQAQHDILVLLEPKRPEPTLPPLLAVVGELSRCSA